MLPIATALLLLAAIPGPQGEPIPPPPAALRERLGLHPFHAKCLVADGLPILASARVHDAALREARHLVDHMLAGRGDLRAEMVRRGTRLVVIAWDERTTDVPEYADMHPARFWDRRARGLGATRARPAVSVGEENLLGYPGDPYRAESILVHEFAHAIHQMGIESLQPEVDARIRAAYRAAMSEGLWKDEYAANDPNEYWAEGVQSWFDTNRQNDHDHNHVDTRGELRAYDPRLAAVIEDVFGDGEWRYTHPSLRPHDDHLAGYDPAAAPTFAWSPALSEWYATWPARERELERGQGEERLAWQRRRAAAGDPAAQTALARALLEGDDPDPAAALGLFLLAAERGERSAMRGAAELLEQGRGCEGPAPESAYRWRVRARGRGEGRGGPDLERLGAELGPERSSRIEREERAWLPRVLR